LGDHLSSDALYIF